MKKKKYNWNLRALQICIGSMLVWYVPCAVIKIGLDDLDGLGGLVLVVIVGALLGALLLYPLALTSLNFMFLLTEANEDRRKMEGRTENITILLGVLYSLIYDRLFKDGGIQYHSDWQEVLTNSQLHTPIWTEAWLTVIVISSVAIVSYLILRVKDVNKLPPLVTVSGIASILSGNSHVRALDHSGDTK